MTKSTITREQLEEWVEQFDEDGGCDATDRQLEALIRQSLAAMDSEPVAWRRFQETPNDGGYWILYDYRPNCSGVEPLYRHAQPALVIPDEMTAEQAYEIGYYYGDPVNVFARGANWMRQHIIDSTLAAAPQSPGSDPATVPGKWIPVSERIPDNTEPVLCIEKRADFGTYGQPFVCWHDGGGWVGKTNYRPIVTHWMPLPAAPQEVSDA